MKPRVHPSATWLAIVVVLMVTSSFSAQPAFSATHSVPAAARIYFTDGGQDAGVSTPPVSYSSPGLIRRVELDGTGLTTLLETDPVVNSKEDFSRPIGIVLDTAAGKFFWTDFEGGVFGANLDGSNPGQIAGDVDDEFATQGIDFNEADGKIYWIFDDETKRVNPDGSDLETIEPGNESFQGGLAVDSVNGRVYTVEGDEIYSSNLDGSDRTLILTLDLSSSSYRGIALDVAGGKLYYTVSGFSSINKRVGRANLDGTSDEVLVDTTNGLTEGGFPWGIALDLGAGHIYWADSNARKIQRANLDGSNVTDIATDLFSPQGIALEPAGAVFNARVRGSALAGSALIYPLFDVNNDAGNARATTIKLSNLGPGKVWVHLVRVCAGIKSFGGKGLCQASNRQVELTPGETFVRDVASFFSIDRDNCPTGYIVAYAQMGENDKTPMVWNHLVGSVHMNSSGSLNQRTSGMQAYGFQARAQEAMCEENGPGSDEPCPKLVELQGNGNGHPSQDGLPVAGASGGVQPVLPFDGNGYAAPATTYSTDYLASIGQRYTDLVLLTLDIEAGFQNEPTVVALDAWNQKEEYHSGAIEYVCHVKVRLDDEINAAQPGAGVQGGMGFGKASNLGSSYGLLQMTPLTEDHAILGATVEMGGNRQTLRGLWHDDKPRPTTFYAR